MPGSTERRKQRAKGMCVECSATTSSARCPRCKRREMQRARRLHRSDTDFSGYSTHPAAPAGRSPGGAPPTEEQKAASARRKAGRGRRQTVREKALGEVLTGPRLRVVGTREKMHHEIKVLKLRGRGMSERELERKLAESDGAPAKVVVAVGTPTPRAGFRDLAQQSYEMRQQTGSSWIKITEAVYGTVIALRDGLRSKTDAEYFARTRKRPWPLKAAGGKKR